MISYASYTTTYRNLALLRKNGWRMLIAPTSHGFTTKGFKYALDNGAWSSYLEGKPFDAVAFRKLVLRLGEDADWIVAPDIVAGGLDSLALSLQWVDRLLLHTQRVLVPVQDGMVPGDVAPYLGLRVGVFLGGSTEYKIGTMMGWGHFCAAKRCWFHVGRVNTAKRVKMAHAAGADSIDGSAASRYALSMPIIDGAIRQPDLWAP
jgi:hypothetical protein